MTRLDWSASGQRFFETGVDRGVLYVKGLPGVAWVGLNSVSESPSGGEARPYYVDGVKYLNLSSAEEYEATINAFQAPPEFGPCDGTVSIQNGLFVTQQPRKQFGFSYRTMVGNDTAGPEMAYKIHLVYNALAAPPQRDNKTLGETADLTALSWGITTLAPVNTGYKPTAHFVIDSRYTLPFRLSLIEDILYGSNAASPSLPSAQELVGLFSELGFPPLKAVMVSANTYEIHEVDPVNARAIMWKTAPTTPAPGEDPILWFDTSGGSYSVPKLVTGS